MLVHQISSTWHSTMISLQKHGLSKKNYLAFKFAAYVDIHNQLPYCIHQCSQDITSSEFSLNPQSIHKRCQQMNPKILGVADSQLETSKSMVSPIDTAYKGWEHDHSRSYWASYTQFRSEKQGFATLATLPHSMVYDLKSKLSLVEKN